jgi:hypothetical protein
LRPGRAGPRSIFFLSRGPHSPTSLSAVGVKKMNVISRPMGRLSCGGAEFQRQGRGDALYRVHPLDQRGWSLWVCRRTAFGLGRMLFGPAFASGPTLLGPKAGPTVLGGTRGRRLFGPTTGRTPFAPASWGACAPRLGFSSVDLKISSVAGG